jgi:hypothetical protein
MTIPSEIIKLWQQHSSAAFPKGYSEKKINGIDLSLLDAEIAGCIHMYMHNREELDSQRVQILREHLIDLNNIILLLDHEELIYFNRLSELANLIIQDLGK